ncbi:MAG: hypothetical protein L0Y57_00030 [Beijerinckiaceae bacterium]|nr:hypothetical protein [Beijerinckiaceae bacterium]
MPPSMVAMTVIGAVAVVAAAIMPTAAKMDPERDSKRPNANELRRSGRGIEKRDSGKQG